MKIYIQVIDIVANDQSKHHSGYHLQLKRLFLQAANWDIPGSIEVDKDLLKCYERNLEAIK